MRMHNLPPSFTGTQKATSSRSLWATPEDIEDAIKNNFVPKLLHTRIGYEDVMRDLLGYE